MRRQLEQGLASLEHARRQVKEEKASLKKEERHYNALQQSQKILQGIAENVQQSAHEQIAGIVTRCLQTVFDDNTYEFRIKFEQRRGKTEASCIFVKDGYEIDPTEDAGGVLDIISFALRLSCILLSRPRRRRVIIADEPMRFVNGAKYQQRTAELLESLAKELGFQFVLVSDDTWLRLGKIIDLGEEGDSC